MWWKIDFRNQNSWQHLLRNTFSLLAHIIATVLFISLEALHDRGSSFGQKKTWLIDRASLNWETTQHHFSPGEARMRLKDSFWVEYYYTNNSIESSENTGALSLSETSPPLFQNEAFCLFDIVTSFCVFDLAAEVFFLFSFSKHAFFALRRCSLLTSRPLTASRTKKSLSSLLPGGQQYPLHMEGTPIVTHSRERYHRYLFWCPRLSYYY